MTPEHVRLLYDFNAWAHHRTLDASAALTGEQFTRNLGSSYGSVRDTLTHLMGGEWFWLERWHGRSPGALPPTEELTDRASLRARWAASEQKLLQFVAGCTAEDLARVQHYRTTEGQPNAQPLWQMLQHLANHGSYHRGQITSMLRQLGAVPAATDLILFYREHAGTLPAKALDPATVRLLFEYNTWANSRTLDACGTLTREQFTRDLGSSFRSVRDTLVHILGAEWVWLERCQGRSPGALPAAEQFPTLASVNTRWIEIERNLLDLVARLSAEELARVHEFRTLKSGIYANALWQALQHVVNHSTYHRGQVAMLLRQSGAKPKFTDLIYFYRERAGQALD